MDAVVDKEKLIHFAEAHKDATLREIAREFGCSGERVRQILVRANVERSGARCPVPGCGKRLFQRAGIRPEKCRRHRRVPHISRPWVTKHCEVCGAEFRCKPTKASPGRFCSKKCLGRYAGEHYGWGVTRRGLMTRPQRSKKKKQKRLDPPGEIFFSSLGRVVDPRSPLDVSGIGLRDALEQVLSTLSEREGRVLALRFGLDGPALTLAAIGAAEGRSSARIGQIEAKALRKLRHPTRSRLLRDYLDRLDGITDTAYFWTQDGRRSGAIRRPPPWDPSSKPKTSCATCGRTAPYRVKFGAIMHLTILV